MTKEGATPVTILTGFLGAGKTTLLERILKDPQGRRFGVLVNDFGAINIDADLVVEASGEQVSLANGCICCSIRDDLVTAIEGLLAGDPRPDHLVIEASGISRPIAVAEALDAPSLLDRVELDGIFCLIDTTGFDELDFASTELAMDQAFGSDVLLLNKCDIAETAAISAVERGLREALPSIRILQTSFSEVPRSLLFGPQENRHLPSTHSGEACRRRRLMIMAMTIATRTAMITAMTRSTCPGPGAPPDLWTAPPFGPRRESSRPRCCGPRAFLSLATVRTGAASFSWSASGAA